MRFLRTGSIVLAAVLVMSGTTAAVGGDVGPAPAEVAPKDGVAALATQITLLPNAWTDTPLIVHLPHAGTYAIDANVRGRLATSAGSNAFIVARLNNLTTSTPITQTERLVYQVMDLNPAGGPAMGGNETAPISHVITVVSPTDIELQGLLGVAAGGKVLASQIYSDPNGYTTLRYLQLADS
ncbi:hypothetical protein [Amycolatopsis sp. CA-126428]|uniref:hypothetical protein n=1 Tax=Amycolatopsis sp. CA-126428 TaxID=2073158 RepID=UPI000CD0845D|nr:hypothetical protein [Amycolatopsis sp. CA-126428]